MLGLYEAAIELARASPCDPRALAGAAFHWIDRGFGYDITDADVWMAYSSSMKAGTVAWPSPETKDRIRELAKFTAEALASELGPSR